MSAWWNLLHKEFRMTRTSALLALAILLIGGLWLVYLSSRYNIGIIIVPASFLLVFLLFYPAIYVLKSLHWEWKVTPHLWLHCPQPAWMLLSSKLAVALLQMLAIMLIAAALLLLGFSVSPIPEDVGGITLSSWLPFIIEVGFYAAVFTFAVSIYIGAWATLISVVNALAGNILGRFRWLAGAAAFVVAVVGFGQLQETRLYELITRWGLINIPLQSLPELPDFGTRLSVNAAIGRLYAGEILFYLLLTAALYALSAWLIDHKVEV
ncbi:hypothetical protein Psch_03915 [Pelotomaculum schinkii]|uniref:ABC-2 family transporter protein n=1 Tax=Pelotomaculum schinkii TaxID=78350 RepID=A0A4Y7R6F2_9FIRM|nr:MULTISPECIES: hypothetical protein [Pelotomaculum]TEB04190.1 hypothetical protein Psch_03915 [Pelotomaculum schinkii]TEB17784.1 hypothetical protein Psfp_00276 [Pelotomaculum sp. FP]